MKDKKKYLIEVIVIIFSILAAFWLDQKAEDFENTKKERQYLKLLKTDLIEDSTNLSLLISYYEERNLSRKILIENLSGTELSKDSLTTLIRGTMGFKPFAASTETFKSIHASGDLYIIQSDLIKIKYMKLITKYETSNSYAVQSFLPMIYDYGLVRWPVFMNVDKRVVDEKNKLYDKEEIDYLAISKMGTTEHIDYLRKNLNGCLEVLSLVSQEIEN